MSCTRLLIVEQDEALRESIATRLEEVGYQPLEAGDASSALALLRQESLSIVLCGSVPEERSGFSLLATIKAQYVTVPVIYLASQRGMEEAIQAIRDGASDYLVKPVDGGLLVEKVQQFAIDPEELDQQVVAHDLRTRELLDLAARVAQSNATVSIGGESGTGKEVFARYIHRQSPRRDGPFVAINCAAIPDNMLEAMLFGYEKGAYTGAYNAAPGKFEQAQGGTLLLDEVSEMSLTLQAKMLRVIQEREVERLGGRKTISLDVRILATTNRNLREEVSAGRFREDLFYRLNVFPLYLPPLRERPNDLLPLANFLLRRLCQAQRINPPMLTPEAEQRLLDNRWSGNVRELDNVMQRALILCNGSMITPEELCFEMDFAQPMGGAPAAVASTPSHQPAEPVALSETPRRQNSDLRSMEEQMIIDALREDNGNRKQVAERLGISPRTLRYKIARMRESGMAIPG